MERQLINYKTLLNVTKAISHSKDPEEVALMTVESIKYALGAKGCALFLINRKTNELELATSYGLSKEYINKGPLSALRSIAQSIDEGPVAICDVMDDPRIQYPEEAQQEGIASILSTPIVVGGKIMGAMRVYTSEPWEFTLEDVNFVQALAQLAGMAISTAKYARGLKSSIEVLKTMREVENRKKTRRTPYEGVPISISTKELGVNV
ncbi:MAG: GAF domain-containing protein [Desulfobacterium sp.]|nr:GAF domain-containing protein [Desulfobacterium sp.]MBU3950014.1 GAF domain-containing protein [Pseudomonadota bacterium]